MENYEKNYETPVMEEIVETASVEENPYGQDFANYRTEYMDKRTFFKNHSSESFCKTIKICAIISYVLIGFNVLSLLVNPLAVLDVGLLLALTIGVHLEKIKGCAIGLMVYGVFSCIVGLLSVGLPAGWIWIVIPIIYLVQFGEAEKEYKAIYGA